MTGHNSKPSPSRFHGGVSLKEHLEAIISLEIKRIDENVVEARRQLEKTMQGFPAEYARKADLLGTADNVQEIKDKELKEIKTILDGKQSIVAYEEKHSTLLSKIDEFANFKTIMETKASQSSVNKSTIIAVIGLLIGIAAAFRAFKV